MSKIVGRKAEIFAAGRDIGGRSNSATLNLTTDAIDATCLGATHRERMSDGLKDAELSLAGFYDEAASQVDALYSSLVGGSTWWHFYPGGATSSCPGYQFSGQLSEYGIEPAVEGALTTTATVAVGITGSNILVRGKSLADHTMTGAGTSALSSVDYTGNTSSPWFGLHILTLAGTTPEIGASLQDSNDDDSFTTIYDFGTASAAGVVLVASAAAASRYQRINVTLAGTSPCAWIVGLSGSKYS